MSIRRSLIAAILVAVGLSAPAPAAAWPERPIRIIVPSPPGGGTDAVTRLLAQTLNELAQWTLVVDNRAGAGGNLGLELAARAAPDGYTIVMGESANLAINPALYKTLPIDPATDIVPVALVGTVPLVLVVPAAAPYADLAALTAAAKAQQRVFASSGNGTVGHLVGEVWRRAAGLDLLHVPYKGAAPVMTDLVGGQVDLHFGSLPAVLALVRSGQLRALAATTRTRLDALPGVPTMIESGFPDFVYHVFYGVGAPRGTPAPILARLNAEIARALATPGLRAGLAARGIDARGGTAEAFGTFLATERATWARAVRESGATVD